MSASNARSLRRTVIATLLIGFALLTAVQYLATALFISGRVDNIEARDGFSRLRRLHHSIDLVREDLEATTSDWAIWDETYRFALGENPAFAEELQLRTFERLRLTFIAIVKDDGEVLFAQTLAPDRRSLTSADAQLTADAQRFPPERSGFIASSFGPLLVSSRSIQDTDMNELGHARLLMGRALASLTPSIARVTSVPLSIVPLAALEHPVADAPQKPRARFAGRDALYLTPDAIDGYTPIDDIAGKPLALLHVHERRSLQPGLQRSQRYLLALTLIVGGVFGIAGAFVLRARVVKPIERIVAAAETIGAGTATSQRLDENHHAREFIALSRSLNAMLDQIEVQQSLRADRDAAVEANRLKSDFLATVSHEIRTPMNGVLGMCELLQRTELDPKQRHLADTLLRSAHSLLGILNDILDFSKIESGKLHLEAVPFSPHELVNNASAPFAAAAQSKGIEVAIDIEQAVPAVLVGDALRVRQVLNNLLSNAVKFTDCGTIEIHCGLAHSDAKGALLRVAVKDTGIGIAPEAQVRIFDAFAQAESSTTRRFGGTGLGLAIVRRIVELMEGEVGVHSEPGRGSTFWFTMKLQRPLASAALLSNGAGVAAVSEGSNRPAPKVLLAEDNEVNREMLTEMLEVIGCQVASVENGARALEAASDASFDAILMDCQMPVMDGHAATAELRLREQARSRPRSFVVALTADATSENRQRCLDAGMDAVLTKPISQAHLNELIAQAMQTRRRPDASRDRHWQSADGDPDFRRDDEVLRSPLPSG